MLRPVLPVLLALFMALSLAAPADAGTFAQRTDAVAKAIERAGDMFNSAKKGHLPSLEVINDLRARIGLARELYDAAVADAGSGNEWRARAELDAAEYLADMVYEASEH